MERISKALIYKGEIVNARSEMLSLTDMWKAVKGDETRRPADWLASVDAKRFIDVVAETTDAENSGIALVETKKGGKAQGTWAHWQIGLAYAKYLSPEFHVWCNTVVRDHMEGRVSTRTDATFLPNATHNRDLLAAVGAIAKKSRDDFAATIIANTERILCAQRLTWKKITKIEAEVAMLRSTVDKLEHAEENVERRVRARLNALTARQIWNRARLRPFKHGPAWLAEQLDAAGATLERNQYGVAKRFDAEKSAELMRRALRAKAEKFLAENGAGNVVSIVS